MSKKSPNLTVIGTEPGSNPLAPPSELGEAGGRLWTDINHDFEILDASGLEVLRQICLAADRASECAEAIARDGAVLRIKGGGIKDHPLLRHEIAARSFVVRSLHRLGLDVIAPRSETGRPAGSY